MKKQNIIIAASFLLLVCLTFGQALTYNFAPSDDLFLVVQNLAIRGISWQNLLTVFTSYDPELYIPLTFVSYQIDYMIGGLQPFVYHATNLVLHTANALLVFWLVQLLVRKKAIAIFTALLFALHPIQTEAVVWIASRKDLLSTFFYLLAFICYIRADSTYSRWYKGSVLLFLAALLAKVMVLTLPFALLLYDKFIHEEKKLLYKNKIPYLFLSVIFYSIAILGKEKVASVLPVYQLLLLGCKSTLFYLGKLFMPVGFTLLHPQTEAITFLSFIPYILGVSALLTVAYVARRKASWLTFGVLLYGGTLAPTFVNVAKADFVFFAVDRYMYLPFIAVSISVAFFLQKYCSKASWNTYITGICVLLLLAVLSFFQVRTWSSPQRLYQQALDVYPAAVPARVSLARLYRKEGQYTEAFTVLQEGLQYSQHPSLYLGAGYVYARVGQVADARLQFTKARELDPKNAEAVFALGSLAEQTGSTEQAIQLYKEAIELDSSYVIARVRYAAHLLSNEEFTAAEQQLLIALKWNPNSVEAHDVYAVLLEQQGNTKAAQEHRSKAAELLEGGNPF